MKLQKVKSLARRYGTPFYCYRQHELCRNYQALSNSFSGLVDVFYSVKANPNAAVIKALQADGAGVEVCSEVELTLALKGSTAHRIIVVGPYKTDMLLKRALEANVMAIVCESFTELTRLQKIARELNTTAKLLVRINPDGVYSPSPLEMGGRATQFGIDECEVFAKLACFFTDNIELIGLHCFSGTRILESQKIVENIERTLALFRRLTQKVDKPFSVLDLGGGFGVNYYSGELPLDLCALQRDITPSLLQFKTEFPQVRLIAESGRYIAASSGTFVGRVVDIKPSKGKIFAILDGGTNCFYRARACLERGHYPIKATSSTRGGRKIAYQLVGPLCTPEDVFARDILLPELEVGDLIMIEKAGAYGFSCSPLLFLNHAIPKELLLSKEEAQVIFSEALAAV